MMGDFSLEVKQLFFNNLQLLGFDVVAMEATNHIPFNKNMFELPNKRGAEIILHFLFERLNPTMSREAFRDVWPILDKKREQAFRKTCANWLGTIAQEEPDSHLPRINASLFMSPGGDKFYDLLMCFSRHVLLKVMDSELVCSYSKPVERLKFPALTPSTMHLGDVMVKEFTCSAIRHRKAYFDITQLTLKAGKSWKEIANEYVKEYRKLSKEIREIDYDIREEEQKSVENSLNRGSPIKKYGKLENLDPTFDPRIIQRAQRIQHVREMWKQLDDFERTEAAEREIVESIVERTINKYKIDATDIHVQVPDMLLRECGEEIRRRNVANTYQGGRLNLESVLQLWNLCLHLYLEKLKQVGMPQFNDDVKKLTSQVHVQQNYLQSAQTLRNRMTERIPVLKNSIEKLREGLDDNMFKDKSPNSIRSTSLGFGLVEPSPQPNFSPEEAITPAQPLEVPQSPVSVDTPAAADKIKEEMRANVVVGRKQLFVGEMDLFSQQGRKECAIPRPGSSKGPSQMTSKQSSSSTHSSASSKGSKRSIQSSGRSTDGGTNLKNRDAVFPTVSSPKTLVERSYQDIDKQDFLIDSNPLSARSNMSSSAESNTSGNSSLTAKASQSPRSFKSLSSRGLSERSHDSEIEDQSKQHGRKTPTDLLVDEIMGEGKILSPFNSGLEAFESRVLVNRTPELETENKENLEPEVDSMVSDTYSNDLNSDVPEDTYMRSQTNNADDNLDRDAKKNEPNGSVAKELDVGQINNMDDFMDRESASSEYSPDKDGVEFEDILGPELDEEYDNDDCLSEVSHTSDGHVIVIDHSLQLSPKHTPGKQIRSEDTKYFIDKENFPSAETSPQEAIVIDHSFQRSPHNKDGERNRNHSNNIPEFMSQSYQGQTVDRDQVKKDLLSQSLMLERSPLIEEIRQMFQKAVEETPPRAQSSASPFQQDTSTMCSRRQLDVTSRQTDGDSIETAEDLLELPDMDINSRQSDPSTMNLQRGNTSWELTENLDDIQMPNFDDHPGLDEDLDNVVKVDKVNYIDSAENDGNLIDEFDDSDKDADTEKKEEFTIPGVVDIEDMDEFFSTKTPELPSRFQGKIRSPRMEGHEYVSIEVPELADGSMEELQLISFTS